MCTLPISKLITISTFLVFETAGAKIDDLYLALQWVH